MPTYRIYYSQRDPGTAADAERYTSPAERLSSLGSGGGSMDETEWEEEVEGRDRAEALSVFFAQHVASRSDVMWVDANGDSHPVEGGEDYQPEKSYIWIEEGKLMQYQGLDEGTPGLVSCPLCDGTGEVTTEVADEYVGESGDGAHNEDRSL
jgi:hypothetical protein